MYKFLFLNIVAAALFFSCSRIPEPISYEYSTQEKMQAVHHWNVLAQDISNRINNELIRSDLLSTAVFVKDTCGSDEIPCPQNQTSEFNEGFRDLLITQLVGFGIPTNVSREGDTITVNYKVQVVRHNSHRFRTIRPGIITALTTAVTVIRNAPSELIAIALASGVDYANAAYASGGNLEVIVTTSMVHNKKYLFRSSDIYYINSEDSYHFQDKPKTNKTIQLTNSGSI